MPSAASSTSAVSSTVVKAPSAVVVAKAAKKELGLQERMTVSIYN